LHGREAYDARAGDFPGELYFFCSAKIGHGSSPVEKSTAVERKWY